MTPPTKTWRLTITRKLTIFQANIGRGNISHTTALATAWERKFNIVLIQDPYFTGEGETRRPIINPGFIAFSPINSYKDGPPGVLTYIRIRPGLQASQVILPNPHRNTLWIKVRGVTIANVYNRHYTHSNILALLSPIKIPEKFLSAGDFNAHHWDWDQQEGIEANTTGYAVSQWARDNNLIVQKHYKKTQRQGFAIDLVFSNLRINSQINCSLRCGSDHETIETVILNPDAPPKAPRAKYRVSPSAIKTFTALIQQHAPLPEEPPDTPERCEKLAEAVLATFRLAIEGSGRKAHHSGHATGWWDEECIEAQERMALDYTTQNKKALYRTVRAKRRAHWDHIIESSGPGKPIFRIIDWRKRKDPFQPPPLKDGDETYSTPKEIASHLGEKLLNRQSAKGDIEDPWAPIPPPNPIPLSLEITEEETREAVLGTGNTSPGSNGITVALLAAA